MGGSDIPDKQVETRVEREDDGRWKKGHSGNPAGRPPKGFSWPDLLEEVGQEIGDGTDKNLKYLASKRAWIEAINGNIAALREIMNRMEGLPKQPVDHTTNGKSLFEKPSFIQQD
jgi:hypothetical protein